MGLNGPDEVKQHIWLKDFDWKGLLQRKLKAGFIPPAKPPVKPKVYDPETAERIEKEKEEAEELIRHDSVQAYFVDYYFDVEQEKFRLMQHAFYRLLLHDFPFVHFLQCIEISSPSSLSFIHLSETSSSDHVL